MSLRFRRSRVVGVGVTVSTPVYEGPFDLLLDLILREEVELYEVSLSSIVDAYLGELEHMEGLDLELATEFLLIAAILVELKARRLLPSEKQVDLDDEFGLWEERDLLLARLVECKTFKDAALVLRSLVEKSALSYPRRNGLEEPFLSLVPDILEGISPGDIRSAYENAITSNVESHIDFQHIAPIRASVTEAVNELVESLPSMGKVAFRDLTAGFYDRIQIVVRFLALLELYKQGLVELDQMGSFGDIHISWLTGNQIVDFVSVDTYEG